MRVIADSLPEWGIMTQHRFMPRAVYDAASLNLPVPDVYEGQDLFYATVHGAPSSLSELLTRQQERSPDGGIQYHFIQRPVVVCSVTQALQRYSLSGRYR